MSEQHLNDNASPEEWVLKKLRDDEGKLLRDILEAAEHDGYDCDVVRHAIRDKEREGKVRVDWDWRYYATS